MTIGIIDTIVILEMIMKMNNQEKTQMITRMMKILIMEIIGIKELGTMDEKMATAEEDQAKERMVAIKNWDQEGKTIKIEIANHKVKTKIIMKITVKTLALEIWKAILG